LGRADARGPGLLNFYGAILAAFQAPQTKARDTLAKAEQLDQILRRLRPRILIFDEFHNCLRGRRRDVEAIFAVLRRLGREYDISPALVGEAAVYDHINLTDEMASRFALAPVPRWSYGEDYLALLDSLEAALAAGPDFAPFGRDDRAHDLRPVRRADRRDRRDRHAGGDAGRAGWRRAHHNGGDRGSRTCPAFAPARLAAARGSAVNRSTEPALLAIEAPPRYRDLLSGHWPVAAGPQPDELLSSWLHRLAFGNGLPPKALGPALDLGSGAWSGRLDLALPAIVRDQLVRCTGLTPGAVGGMTLAGAGARALLLPSRADLSPGRRGRRQATWLQFCPQCLAEDEEPYFRREWRLATTIICARHGSRLLDRCPACGQGLAPINQASLRPQNDCATCGFDLANAKAPHLGMVARPRPQIWQNSPDA
jgi:Bacterial TniB protein/TniQ